MPYKDPGKQKEAVARAVARHRGITEPGITTIQGITEEDVIPKDVIPLDPKDWRDRRNYSDAYLAVLDEQGGKLTELSVVAMKSYLPDPETCLLFTKKCGANIGRPFIPNCEKKRRGISLAAV